MAQDVGQVKLEDSNMANYGSEEHKQMRQDAAKKEKAWEKAGDSVGVQVWRIEKFKVKHWPKDRYGEFYSGDSYIILHTNNTIYLNQFFCYAIYFINKKDHIYGPFI